MASTHVTHRGIEVQNIDGQSVCIGVYCLGFYRDLKDTALKLQYTFTAEYVDCATCAAVYPDVLSVRSGTGMRVLERQDRATQRAFAAMQHD